MSGDFREITINGSPFIDGGYSYWHEVSDINYTYHGTRLVVLMTWRLLNPCGIDATNIKINTLCDRVINLIIQYPSLYNMMAALYTTNLCPMLERSYVAAPQLACTHEATKDPVNMKSKSKDLVESIVRASILL